jgi:hypothetical protein
LNPTKNDSSRPKRTITWVQKLAKNDLFDSASSTYGEKDRELPFSPKFA